METEKMRTDSKEIILPNQQLFTFTIQPFELTNFLGVLVATLREYYIQNEAGEIYKLYKTAEGNWYDIAEESAAERNAILRLLKNAIEMEESKI